MWQLFFSPSSSLFKKTIFIFCRLRMFFQLPLSLPSFHYSKKISNSSSVYSHFNFFPFDLQRSCTNLLVKFVLIKVSSKNNSNSYIYIFILGFCCKTFALRPMFAHNNCGCFMVQSFIERMNEKSLLLMHARVHRLQRSVLSLVFSVLVIKNTVLLDC